MRVLDRVGKFTNIRQVRNVIWVKSAHKTTKRFPLEVQQRIADTLEIVANGTTPDAVRPMKGLASGVFEIRIAYRTNAYRAVYALNLAKAIYVLHAFQKKSTQGIATPKKEIETIKSRLKMLKDRLT